MSFRRTRTTSKTTGRRRHPARHVSPAKAPHSRRPGLEALERRRLLSVSPAASSGVLTAFASSALAFEPNVGQTDAQVRYLSRGDGYALFLTDTDAVLRLGHAAPSSSAAGANQTSGADSVVDIGLVGANLQPQITPLSPLPSVTNYIGSDAARTHAHLANYSRVAYHDVYPGVDLVYYGTQGQLEYDFVVAAGADPNAIALNVQGADGLKLDDQGNLVIHTSGGDVVEHAPVVYQAINCQRQSIDGHYVLSAPSDSPAGTYQVRFQVGAYDHSQPLTIDPVLTYSTYFGGSQLDAGSGIAVDGKGNVYVTGYTESSDLPKINGAGYQKTFNSPGGQSEDAFVLKLDPTGQPVYFTYLGGNEDDSHAHPLDPGSTITVGYIFTSVRGDSIAVDSQGRATVVGDVEQNPGANLSTGNGYQPFPVTGNALQPNAAQGQNGFLTRLTPDGSNLDYSTFINAASVGANSPYNVQIASAVASGPADAVYATGYVALFTSDGTEVSSRTFLVVINGDGSSRFATSYGGDASTHGFGVAVDTAGNGYITGSTNSSNFATTTPTGVASLGGFDAFVLKVNPNPAVTSPVYAARIGGSRDDVGLGIAVDKGGAAYVTGYTASANFPAVNAFQSNQDEATDPAVGFKGTTDAFVTKLDPSGTKIVYSTYLGGSLDEHGNAIAVDPAGDAVVAGNTDSRDFPLVRPLHIPGGYGDTYGGGQNDAFVAEFDPSGGNLLFSTYLGGGNHVFNGQSFTTDAGNDVAQAIALDSLGDIYVTGTTGSSDFPTAGNPLQLLFGGGGYDGFIARLAPPLTVVAQGFSAQRNVPFSNLVANFVSPEANGSPTDFSATIDWGDGTSSPADGNAIAVTFQTASRTGIIQGNHTYTKVGAFPVTVVVTDTRNGQTARAAVNVSQTSSDASSPTIAVDPIAVDPTKPNPLFMASAGAAAGLFTATSDDGGQTWMPVDPVDQQIADGNDKLRPAFGFPQAVFDGFGNLFLSYIGADQASVVVALSQDGGHTFTPLFNGPITGATPGTLALGVPKLSTGPTDAQGNRETWLAFKDKVKDVIDAKEFMATPAGQITVVPFAGASFLTLPSSSGTRDDVS
ncbi:MAG TPA: SBBP repeat-containing protein, partial [Pirellulales bacterium]|nr:SBBP repeat-containing protein [Pirellulales bacterium]